MSSPLKPSQFTALTQDDWDDFWKAKPFDFRLDDCGNHVHWYEGMTLNEDKKKNPFVWMRQVPGVGGKMKKVVWSYGAYYARHYPHTKIAKEWIDWAGQFGWRDYCF